MGERWVRQMRDSIKIKYDISTYTKQIMMKSGGGKHLLDWMLQFAMCSGPMREQDLWVWLNGPMREKDVGVCVKMNQSENRIYGCD